MSTRITTGMIHQRVLGDLHDVSARLTRTQQKISSNREIERPSDDPFGASRAMLLRENLDGIRQYQRNVDDARGWQDAAEASMNELTLVVQDARELLLQGGSDTVDQTSRNAIALELDQLAEALKENANGSYKGQFLFGGIRTDQPPYAVGGTDAYNGVAGTVARQIGTGVSLQINVDLRGVLGDGQAAADDGLLDVLRDAAAHLRAGDAVSVKGTDLERLDEGFAKLLEVRAANGARSNRLDAALGRLGELEEAAVTQLSQTEDADMGEVLMQFNSQSAAYQAALRAGANIVQASLMDFLR